MKKNYYEQQLEKLDFTADNAGAACQFLANGNSTKWLSLNEESARAIVAKLIATYGPGIVKVS